MDYDGDMDVEWAKAQCREYLRINGARYGSDEEARSVRVPTEEKKRLANRLRLIAEAVYGISQASFPMYIDDVRTLLFELEEGSEVRARLGLTTSGPALAADRLHPWVWTAARPHWESGNMDAAVWAAAVNVNSCLRRKVDRPELGESKLVTQAFSTNAPEPGKTRLRLCDESNPLLFKDRHVGATSLGQGLFSGVRNPVAHEGMPHLTEQEALEILAAWSLFARWIDTAELVRGEPED